MKSRRPRTVDDFEDVSAWSAVTSGQAELIISRDKGSRRNAMRLDFDFKGGGGFVVARRTFSLALPESYAFSFGIRGSAPANRLELKLSDPSHRNVWWYHQDAFNFPATWRRMRIRSSEIDFAWGPAGGGAISRLGAIELVIAAGRGGKGTVWIEDLCFEDTSFRSVPIVQASTFVTGHPPQSAVDSSRETGWRSATSEGPEWLSLDFQEPREYGGMIIDWEPGAGARVFEVQTSDDGAEWTTAYKANHAGVRRSYIYLPNSVSRYLRLYLLERGAQKRFGILDIDIKPYDFSRSINAFFGNIARSERKGLYPRYLYGEQSFWTPIGIDGGSAPGLLNQEGLVEVDPGSFSLEPFLYVDGALVTWADADITQELAGDYLPIPSSSWRNGDLVLRTTVFADGAPGPSALWVRYRLENAGGGPQRLRLFVAVRPFQVSPPWQAFRNFGGVSPIREISCTADAVWINGSKVIAALERPTAYGAAAFEQGAITEYLAAGELPPSIHARDDFGYASAALSYDLTIAAGGASEVYLAAPFGSQVPSERELMELRSLGGAARLEAAMRCWQEKLGRLEIHVPAATRPAIDAMRTAAAHILINRDGVALQPGPRRYTRSWIRDASTMGAALLRMGCVDEVRDFIRWYASYQTPDGAVPCCVDRSGPDWLVEHDSHGQLIFIIAEYVRFSDDRAFVSEMWPAVLKAANHLESLRRRRLTPEFETPEKRACYGLLPESASHEGYLAHPVHAYWDDFWALRGLSDAAFLARLVNDRDQASRLGRLRDSFRETLYASIALTIAERHVDYIPASVEWADFDPTATATAITTTDAARRLPATVLARTYDEYLAGFRKRRRGEIDWNNYSAYEIRNVGALLRLGRPHEALELLQFFLDDRRPVAWNQWPEITWPDPHTPGHIGDVPHAWIGAEYVLAVLGLFAFEREADEALVVAAGIPAAWLDGGAEVGVERLATYYGSLTYALRCEGDDALRLSLRGDITVPPGGLVLAPPLQRPLRHVEVDGKRISSFDAGAVTITSCPAEVLMRL